MGNYTMKNLVSKKFDVFSKFHKQNAIVCAGNIEDYNCMTIGWGMMGNVWGHPGSAITIYVSPDRYTWEYLEKNDYFTVSFFPEEYTIDLMYLGTHSGRDENKVRYTNLTPKEIENGVAFEQAELTFICRKVYSHQFDISKVPANMRENVYTKISPHYEYIGFIEGVE